MCCKTEGHTDRGAIAGDSRLAAIHHTSESLSESVGHTDRPIVVSWHLQCHSKLSVPYFLPKRRTLRTRIILDLALATFSVPPSHRAVSLLLLRVFDILPYRGSLTWASVVAENDVVEDGRPTTRLRQWTTTEILGCSARRLTMSLASSRKCVSDSHSLVRPKKILARQSGAAA